MKDRADNVVQELSVKLHHEVISAVKAIHEKKPTNVFNYIVKYIREAYTKGRDEGSSGRCT